MYRNRVLARSFQRGAGLVTWLALLAIFFMLSSLALRIAPLYWNYTNVVSLAQEVQQDRELANASRTELWRILDRRLSDADLAHLTVGIFRLEGSGREFALIIDYEERTNFVGNLDIVAKFERRIGPEQ